MYAPTRWLLELYPIDEILASELKIDLKNIHFEMAPIGSPAYEVIATAPGRRARCSSARSIRPIVERPFFDRFPDYEHVRVTTGWIKASVGGKTAVDERIETDPERFWDRFQSKTLPALYDHVMALEQRQAAAGGRAVLRRADGRPDDERARATGCRSTRSRSRRWRRCTRRSTSTRIHFFDVMGRFTRGAGLAYPGRIIPVMHPEGRRQAGPREDLRHRLRRRPAHRSSSSTKSGTDAAAWRGSTSRRSRSIGRRRWRPPCARARRHRAARPAREGRHARRTSASRSSSAATSSAWIARCCRPNRCRAVIGEPRTTADVAGSTAMRWRTTISADIRLTIGWEHESKPGAEQSSPRSSLTAPLRRFPTSRNAARAAGVRLTPADADRPMGHADSAAGGERDAREDVGVQGGDRLQGRRRATSARTSGRWT